MFKVGDRVWVISEKRYGVVSNIEDTPQGLFIHIDNRHSYVTHLIHQTAQTMFEELGFTKEIDSKYDEVYSNHYGTIIFDTNSYVIVMNDKKVSPVINIKIHLAIHQQLIEMGWVE